MSPRYLSARLRHGMRLVAARGGSHGLPVGILPAFKTGGAFHFKGPSCPSVGCRPRRRLTVKDPPGWVLSQPNRYCSMKMNVGAGRRGGGHRRAQKRARAEEAQGLVRAVRVAGLGDVKVRSWEGEVLRLRHVVGGRCGRSVRTRHSRFSLRLVNLPQSA